MPPAATSSTVLHAARYWRALAVGVLALELLGRWVAPPPWAYYRGFSWAKKELGPFHGDQSPGPFFANVRYEGTAYGDLAYVGRVRALRVERPQIFTTDAYGYRNAPGGERGPWRVLAVGDSVMAGAGLDDADTFPAHLADLIDAPVYNAGASWSVSLFTQRRFQQRPPRYLLLQTAERYVVGKPDTVAMLRALPPPGRRQSAWVPTTEPPPTRIRHRTSEVYSTATHFGSLAFAALRLRMLGSVSARSGLLGTDGRTLFGMETVKHALLTPDQLRLDLAAESVDALRDWFGRRGVQLVYLVTPDKATVYRELLPDGWRAPLQPPGSSIVALHQRLDAFGVPYVDALSAMLAAKAQPGPPLYWPDDTHWSPRGARVVAEAAAARLAQLDAAR